MITIVERLDLCFVAIAFDSLFRHLGDVFLDLRLTISLLVLGSHTSQNLVGDILHIDEEGDGESLHRDLFLFALGPETVLKVVVLHSAVRLHVGVAAVVVSEQQSLRRDELGGAAAAEEHDGILHAVVVDAVDVIGGKMEAELLHFSLVLAQIEGNPHAAVGFGETDDCRE